MISLGQFDVVTAVMTMSRFRAAPRQRHLDRLKCIYGYVKKMNDVPIKGKSMPDDNQVIVTSSSFPYSNLNHHRVRENIADDLLAGLLPKHWGYALMKPLLFWKGETMDTNDGVVAKTPPHDRTKGEYNEVGHINGILMALQSRDILSATRF